VVGERIAGWTGQIGPVTVRGEEGRIARTVRRRAFEVCILDPVFVSVSSISSLTGSSGPVTLEYSWATDDKPLPPSAYSSTASSYARSLETHASDFESCLPVPYPQIQVRVRRHNRASASNSQQQLRGRSASAFA
jgi:hypothetical protein